MADRDGDRHGVSNGANSRALNETVAETGPGIPDDAVLDGELAPGDLGPGPTEEEAARLRRSGWAGRSAAESGGDAEAESEAHPS